jgi:Ni/Fe-hydrogenase subunit HybB-like protein
MPLWYSPILPLLFFVSSIMAGLSLAALTYMGATHILRLPAKREIVTGLPRIAAWVAVLYLVAALLLLFGVMMNRFNATMFGQILPPGTTYTPHLLEWLSTIGIIGAAVMAWLLGVRFLAIFDDKSGQHG